MKNPSVKVAALLLTASIFSAQARAQQLSPEERKVVDQVDAQRGGAVAFLEEVVNIMSPTEDHAGVRQVGAAFKQKARLLRGALFRWGRIQFSALA